MERSLRSVARTVDLVEVLLVVGLEYRSDLVACTVAAEVVRRRGCNFVAAVRRKLVSVVVHHTVGSLGVDPWVGRRSARLHMAHSAAGAAYIDFPEERKSSHSSAAAGERHMADSSEAYTVVARRRADLAEVRPKEDLRSADMADAVERKSFHSSVVRLHRAGSAAEAPKEGRRRSLDYAMAAEARHKADLEAERPREDRRYMSW